MRRLLNKGRKKPGMLARGKVFIAALAVAGIMGCGNCGANVAPKDEVPSPSAAASDTDSRAGSVPDGRGGENPFDIDIDFSPAVQTRETYCFGYPEIETWSERRGLDPNLTRAVVATESGFDECAAAKVCASGYDGPGCFEPGPAEDPGYRVAYDEMYDPAETCSEHLVNAPNQVSSSPAWRFLGLGIMQTLEPPYTFWPASHHPLSMNGSFFDVFSSSGLSHISLDEARDCSPLFNPFDPGNSICLGTSKLSMALEQARSWISANRDLLNWGPDDTRRDEAFAMYVAAHIYTGTWYSSIRSSSHPRCPSSVSNAECWSRGFNESWRVTEEYCQPDEDGHVPVETCDGPGSPRREPPESCYGYDNIIRYIGDCEIPFLDLMDRDIGEHVLELYYWLRNNCRPGSSDQIGYQHPPEFPFIPHF